MIAEIIKLVKMCKNVEKAPTLLEATESAASYSSGHSMILTEEALERYRANQGYSILDDWLLCIDAAAKSFRCFLSGIETNSLIVKEAHITSEDAI